MTILAHTINEPDEGIKGAFMKIAIGADHAGFELKEALKKHLIKKGFSIKDFGTFSEESVDYPDIAIPLAKAIGSKQISKGILLCGSGVGVTIVANRVEGVRAVNAISSYAVKQSREHGDTNILCLGGRTLPKDKAIKYLDLWLATKFSGDPRHVRRLKLIENIPAAISAARTFYIDTSVPNFILAERNPDHVAASISLFKAIKQRRIKAYISTVVIQEISKAGEPKRSKLLAIVKRIEELELNKKAASLARYYIKNRIIPAKYLNDALHIAIAVVNRVDCLVSWNFKHLVNIESKERINHLNYKLGFRFIDLISPEEVIA